MKQWLRSIVLLAIPVVAWACSGDPTESIVNDGTPVQLVASPSRVFVTQGGSEAVSVRLVDARGNPVPTTFSFTQPTAPSITVTEDTTQKLIYDANGVLVRPKSTTAARYIVAASAFESGSFTVTAASGQTITIAVDATPGTLPATFSKTAINLGDTITITAPAGTFIRSGAAAGADSTKVTFASGIAPIIVSVSADSSSIRVIPGPNTAGAATLTNLGVRYNTGLKFTSATTTGVTSTPPIVSAGTVAPTAPTLGQTITITVPAGSGERFLPGLSKVYFNDSTDLAKNVVVAPDSQSISFIAPPNRVGVKVSVTQVIHTKLPQVVFRQTLTTTNSLTTPAIAAFSGTLSTTTPAAGQQVTLTGSPGFKISPNATVAIGGKTATTIGVSADSTVLTFVAVTGSSGPVQLTGTVAGGFALAALPTGLTLTAATGAIPAVAGTDAFATAPTITITKGKAVGVVSGAPFTFANTGGLAGTTSQLFKFTTTTANQVIKFDVWASGGADLGLYFYKSDFTLLGTSAALSVDAKGSGSGNAESGSVTFAAVGTYYISVVTFDPDPIAYGVTVTPQ